MLGQDEGVPNLPQPYADVDARELVASMDDACAAHEVARSTRCARAASSALPYEMQKTADRQTDRQKNARPKPRTSATPDASWSSACPGACAVQDYIWSSRLFDGCTSKRRCTRLKSLHAMTWVLALPFADGPPPSLCARLWPPCGKQCALATLTSVQMVQHCWYLYYGAKTLRVT